MGMLLVTTDALMHQLAKFQLYTILFRVHDIFAKMTGLLLWVADAIVEILLLFCVMFIMGLFFSLFALL